jgi:hypothetical protein
MLGEVVDTAFSRPPSPTLRERLAPWDHLIEETRAAREGVKRLAFSIDGHKDIDEIDHSPNQGNLHAAWWTDALGRKHWAAEAVPAWDEEPPQRGRPFDHPLSWISPTSFGARERSGQREFVVICRCGVVGPPESVAWMGGCCGPCFDREQEGLPALTLGPNWSGFEGQAHFLSDGRFLTTALPDARVSPKVQGSVCLWGSLDDRVPTWTSRLNALYLMACSPQFLAFRAPSGQIVILDTTSGETALQPASPRSERCWSPAAAGAWAAGPNGPRLISVEESPGGTGYFLAAHDLGPRGTEWTRAWAVECSQNSQAEALHASPDGRLFLVHVSGWVELRDASNGAVVSVLAQSSPMRPLGTFLQDGSIIGPVGATAGWRAGLWASEKHSANRRGFWGWFMGSKRGPDLAEDALGHLGAVAEAPHGEIAALESNAITARCARTLRLRAAFRAAGWVQGPISVTRDGRLLIRTNSGLTVWPWRELMGEP